MIERLQAFLGALLICGGIGAFFWGETGFFWGFLLAVLVGIFGSPEEHETESKNPARVAPPRPQQRVTSSTPKDRNLPGPGPFRRSSSTNAAPISDSSYEETVVQLIAACVTSDGEIEESEIDLATSFIEADEHIIDKSKALEALKSSVDEFYSDRKKSKAIFNLKMTTVVHKVKEITDDLKKERVQVILDGMLDTIKDGDRSESAAFVEKVKLAIAKIPLPDLKRSTAEQYILNSGDQEAIQQLREMRKKPGEYKERLRKAAKGNTVMKTALGVFTGMIAANLVTSAFHKPELNHALADFDSKLESMGGLDNINLDSPALASMSANSASETETFSDDYDIDSSTDMAPGDLEITTEDIGVGALDGFEDDAALADADIGDVDADIDFDGGIFDFFS